MIRALAFVAACAGLVCAQEPPGVSSLLAEAASFARTGVSWKAEGVRVTTGLDGAERAREQFRIAYRVTPPFAARLEITSGDNQLLRVCDGEAQWTNYPALNGYVRVIIPQIGPCADPLNVWPVLGMQFHSPVAAGTERVTVDGRERECRVVRERSPAATAKFATEACIDPATKLVLRYREAKMWPHPHTETWVFSSLVRDGEIDSDLLEFHPPKGSAELAIIHWLDPAAQPGPAAYRVSNEVPPPILLHMAAPELPAGPDAPGGKVVMIAEIGPDGIPRNIKVAQTSANSLRAKAIESVEKWRFEPTALSGEPVSVVTVIAVNFPGK